MSSSNLNLDHTSFFNKKLIEAVQSLEVPQSESAGWQRDAARAIALARRLLDRSHELLTSEERRQQAELSRMIGHHADKATLVEMTDQAFRT
ncbi:MAG: hypothetical protein R3C05_09050 [Pirellulaceae bacterium]